MKGLRNAKTIMFADDTVVYADEKNVEETELLLNDDLKRISSHFQLNQLVINLKKEKTESMVFGTAARLSKSKKALTYITTAPK